MINVIFVKLVQYNKYYSELWILMAFKMFFKFKTFPSISCDGWYNVWWYLMLQGELGVYFPGGTESVTLDRWGPKMRKYVQTNRAQAQLTHWGRDKVDASSQTTFWNAFSPMKIYEFHLRFDWSLFLRFKLIIFQHWFRDNGLAPTRQQAITWTNDGYITDPYMRHSAPIG